MTTTRPGALRGTPIGFALAAGVIAVAVLVLAPQDAMFLIDSSFELSRVTDLLSALFPLSLAAAVPVAVFRPVVAVALGAVPSLLVLISGPVTVAGVIALVGVGVVAAWRSPRWAALALVSGWVLVLVPATGRRTLWIDDAYQIDFFASDPFGDRAFYAVTWAIALTLPVVIALFFASQIRKTRQLTVRERELVGQTELVDRQATVLGERARLARDLHDVVAHHVSLIAVRAETAPYADPGMPSRSREVLAEIADDARSALDELRGVLGILQRADGGSDRSPLPGLDDLEGLVARARSAGDDVSLTHTGDPETTNAATGYVAYRVVQEALTNARKHAAGQPVAITLETGTRTLRLLVRNPVLGGPGEGSRRGLAGMRERVEGIGGHFSADLLDGEFVVDVRIPATVSP